MDASEPFTVINGSHPANPQLFDTYQEFTSAKLSDVDVQLIASLREQYPELVVTTVPGSNVNLLQFAAAGFATADLDAETDSIVRWRGYVPAAKRGEPGVLGEAQFFAKYHYKWHDEDFILFVVQVGFNKMQYVLKEPRGSETTTSNSAVTDSMISAVGNWLTQDANVILVYDRYWAYSKELFNQVQKASWDAVILDPKMKRSLTEVANKFFDSKEVYEEYGVPWKRGLIFYGPPGNGKTISIKALMHTLYKRKPLIPALYVKSAPQTYDIRAVFMKARQMSPCLLILEDIETIVTPQTRSYFFNEVDGLENNDGILMVASTNFMNRLDPGLSKRPSRFDRKYLFPLPSEVERTLYCEYWRKKLRSKPLIDFPEKLCPAIAAITAEFSFAYLQEAFIATLLVLAREEDLGEFDDDSSSEDGDDDSNDDLERYDLYRIMKKQVNSLRKEMGGKSMPDHDSLDSEADKGAALEHREEQLRSRLAGTNLGDADLSAYKADKAAQGFGMMDGEGIGAMQLSRESAVRSMAKQRYIADTAFAYGPSG